MFYTKFDTTEAATTWPQAPVVAKPARSAEVAETVAGLLPLAFPAPSRLQ